MTSFTPLIGSENDQENNEIENNEVNSNGIGWKPLVPIKKATFVEYDPDTYLDDYAYLASIPASVFQEGDKLYSSPLLYYENDWEGVDEEKVMNSVQGIEYFMEDWVNISGGELDIIEYIKMPNDENPDLKWTAKEIIDIKEKNPYDLASKIALQNWEYSDVAVIAVIDEYPEIDNEFSGYYNGTIPSLPLEQEVLQGSKAPSPINPNYHNFTINEGYKYVTSYMEWGGATGDATHRGKDLDLQLYDWQLGEVAASENWNVFSGAHEYTDSFVYDIGEWAAAVTYMPTESTLEERNPKDLLTPIRPKPLQNPLDDEEDYTIYVTLYPGDEIFIEEPTPFGCRDAEFKISWEGDHNLGLMVRGPSGAVIGTDMSDQGNEKVVNIDQLGEGIYSAAAIDLNGDNTNIDFNFEYSFSQKMDKIEGNSLSSASNGAILASIKNAPLLFAKPKSLPKVTGDTLDKLGVKNAFLINLGGYASGKLNEDIDDLRSWLQDEVKIKAIDNHTQIYNMIQKETGQNDIVFSTINPWTYWYIGEGIVGEQEKGTYIGPAAYAAAFHGAPLLITDIHPKLSASQSWHNEFWKHAFMPRAPPSVGCMVLTGKQVYEFLDENNLDNEGMESILTVGGQFDIGTTWDRMLVGAALSGRIQGSPIDTSYWIARTGLYPFIIFANPALDENGVTLTTGSSFDDGIMNSAEVDVKYPIVQSWVSYQHRFNERASDYWGCDYITADGITPYKTKSNNPIDDGVNGKYNQDGMYWPDLTSADIIPFYAEKLDCDSVYSTNFDTTMDNINRGSIMWLEGMHGGSRQGLGVVGFWNPDQPESNPWRGYEKGGGTEENPSDEGGPDTVTMERNTAADVTPATPYDEYGHDGVVIAIAEQGTQTTSYDGYNFDNSMKNIHSTGFSGTSCLIANTYLHLSLIRHGSVFQVIDPWLTSWYSAFAIETFLRDIALGDSVGQAYEKGIRHVGIQYLTNSWWWDIFENVVYYGDPDLRVFTPKFSWDKPDTLEFGLTINGHAPFGANSYPHEIESASWKEIAIIGSIIGGSVIAVGIIIWKKKE